MAECGDTLRPVDVFLLAHAVINSHKDKYGDLKAPIQVKGADGLLATISEQVDAKIIDECLPWPGRSIKASFQYYEADKIAKIFYSTSLNACWSRFAICKEAMHLLCGRNSNQTKDPESLIKNLISGTPVGINDEIDIEILAIHGAIELLLPTDFVEDIYQKSADGMSDYEIALDYRVPEDLISFRLSPAGRDFYEKINKQLAETKKLSAVSAI